MWSVIRLHVLQGYVDRSTGKAELTFLADFMFTAGPLYAVSMHGQHAAAQCHERAHAAVQGIFLMTTWLMVFLPVL